MYSKSAATAVERRDAHDARLAETRAAAPFSLHCHLLSIGTAVIELVVEKDMPR